MSPFYPLLTVFLTLLVWAAFQTIQLRAEKEALQAARVALVQKLQSQQRVQLQLEALATGLQALASEGNRGAATIVEQLRRRGVTISAGAAPVPAVGSGETR